MDKIDELLSRSVDKIYPSRESLAEVLRGGKKLKLYQGFDPTGDKLHIGHLVGLRKLRAWQDLGHEVVFLIGDGTGQAGDPSGKTKAREKFFTKEELRKNAEGYVKQASKVLDFEGKNPVQVLFNSEWLNELKLVDILEIVKHFSWQQLAERDLFQERIKKGETLNMREALYPFLQSYDSVAMDVDLEIGGSDQTFNMLCGRSLLKAMKGKEKFVMTTPLLADSKGVKIGKTEGNVLALDDTPENLFGGVMSFPDEVIVKCFECLTTLPREKVKEIEEKLKGGDNPMEHKKNLAFQIVLELHNQESAEKARENFENTFQRGEVPEEMTEIKISGDETLSDILVRGEVVSSKTDFRRLIEEGAITLLSTGEKISDPKFIPEKGAKFKVGKRRFVKVV